MKKILLVFTGTILLISNGNAQNNEGLESILFASGDAEKLTTAYINPAMKGLIYGMNNGWYHTAKNHKLFGFDISIGLNGSLVSSQDEIFRFTDLGLSSITSTSSTAATVAGPGDFQASATFSGIIQDQNVTATFTMPGGIKDELPLKAIPTPAVQFNMGLPLKIDGMIRLVPNIGSDDIRGNLVGVGLKKEITRWFVSDKKSPLHISLLAAHTTMNVDYEIQNNSSIDGSNQRSELKLNSYTLEAIASLNFPFINFFGGFGYNSGKSKLTMLGTYHLEYDTGQPAPNDTFTETLVDPLSLDFNSNSFKTTLGTRINLGFFKIFGSYTIQEYHTFNAGIAFSFR